MMIKSFLMIGNTLRNGMIELTTTEHPEKKDSWVTVAVPLSIYTILQNRKQHMLKEHDNEEDARKLHYDIASGIEKIEVVE